MLKKKIREIAIDMVKKDGIINLSRAGLCARAEIPDGSFPHVMGCTFSEFVKKLQAMKIDNPLKKVTRIRASNPSLRREHILGAAVKVAKGVGYLLMTREQIAEAAGVSASLITRYYTMAKLRKVTMALAIATEVYEVIAQGLAAKDPQAKKAPASLRVKAVNFLVK